MLPRPPRADADSLRKREGKFAAAPPGGGLASGPLLGQGQESAAGAVLVCGLGTLGAECVSVLGRYGVRVRAVELGDAGPAGVEIVRGDCRLPDVLRRAGIEGSRAVVLVTGDARVNVEAALAARKLDAHVRIVARAPQDNVHQLLSARIGNFVAYEPSRLAAGALALAAGRGDVVGYFRHEGALVRVLRQTIGAGSRWHGAATAQLGRHGLIVLDHAAAGDAAGAATAGGTRPGVRPGVRPVFHGHDPAGALAEGDRLTFLTVEREGSAARARRTAGRAPRTARGLWAALRRSLRRPAGVMLAALAVVVASLLVAAIAFPAGQRDLSALDGVFSALVLMTGGTYADLFPPFHHLSNALRLLSVALSVVGTLFIGLLYALLTERMMTLRLRLGGRRPPAPRDDHVVVVGLGSVGRHATLMFQELEYPVAAVERGALPAHAVPGLPVVVGNAAEGDTLAAAHVDGARAVLAATRDEWLNLEIALQVRRVNPTCDLVIRTQDARFSENISGVVPGLQALCVPVIAARAFAAAALGGRVLDLFQLGPRTIYAVEHEVRPGDGLDGRLLAEIAEGYEVAPVWYASGGHAPRFWSPADPAVRLGAGDRAVLLGASSSLQSIARAEMRPRTVALRLTSRRPYADAIAVASLLVQHTGATLEQALEVVATLPRELPGPLYPHQAHRLKAGLEVSGVTVEVVVAPAGRADEVAVAR
jgi:Trk K+ transport system NAD-binding subunit